MGLDKPSRPNLPNQTPLSEREREKEERTTLCLCLGQIYREIERERQNEKDDRLIEFPML